MATRFGKKNPLLKCNALLWSKVMQGSAGVKLLRNVLWPPNLVRKNPYENLCIAGVIGHAGVSQGQPEVKLLRNALWLRNQSW